MVYRRFKACWWYHGCGWYPGDYVPKRLSHEKTSFCLNTICYWNLCARLSQKKYNLYRNYIMTDSQAALQAFRSKNVHSALEDNPSTLRNELCHRNKLKLWWISGHEGNESVSCLSPFAPPRKDIERKYLGNERTPNLKTTGWYQKVKGRPNDSSHLISKIDCNFMKCCMVQNKYFKILCIKKKKVGR